MLGIIITIAGIIIFILLISIKQINEYQKGVKFILGKYSGLMSPGWRLVFPIVQSYRKVDLRVKAVDVPSQEAITKDNISVGVNAVIYYKVQEADKAILEVENFYHAISQLAQTTMRNAVGQVELDELLSQRDRVSENIRTVIDRASDPWGIKVDSVELKDVTLPEAMKRTISKQAEAEREKRAIIIKAQGELIAADNISKAARTLSSSVGALHLRTLQSLNDISSDQSNTIVFAMPLEILRAFERLGKGQSQKNLPKESLKIEQELPKAPEEAQQEPQPQQTQSQEQPPYEEPPASQESIPYFDN